MSENKSSLKKEVIFTEKNYPIYNTLRKILFVFLILIVVAVTVVEAEVINFAVEPANPIKGEVVTIHGQAQPNEDVTIRILFEKVVQVEDKKYTFFVPKINIPEAENRFTVTAEGCEDLRVSIKDYAERYPHWVTRSSEANGVSGVAEISEANIPAVIYDVLIHGRSSEESVRLTITAEGYVKADNAGDFSYTYETSSLPTGKFIVQAGNKTETVYLRLPPPPTAPVRIVRRGIQSSSVIELLQLLLVLLAFVVPLVILAWKRGK